MRSAEAHARLVAHDTALPGLSALLDDVVLSERLGAPSTRTYLRYKTGTNATALVDVAGRPAIANAWPAGGGAKRAKALKDVAAADVLLDAPEDGLLVVDAMADRRLPALRRLVHTGRIGPWLAERGHPVDPHARPRTLAHKPGRRWVGSIPLTGHRAGEHVVLRAYTVDEFDAALAAHELADPGRHTSLRLPRVLRTHRRGLIALEHLPGRTLDETVDADCLRRLGTGLGELHASGHADLITTDRLAADGLATDRGGATTGLDVIAPVLGDAVDDAADVHARASGSLRPSSWSIIHGDLSLDQVIADGDGLGLIDLDRVRVGNPLDDLASLLAVAGLGALNSGGARAAAALVERLGAPLLTGHASTWTGPVGDDLGPRTALAVLDRAGEPFRSGHPRWPDVTRELIALAGTLAEGRVLA